MARLGRGTALPEARCNERGKASISDDLVSDEFRRISGATVVQHKIYAQLNESKFCLSFNATALPIRSCLALWTEILEQGCKVEFGGKPFLGSNFYSSK
jgi:hypothetical protein